MRPAFLAVLGSLVAAPAAAQAITPPPDAPATVELRDTLLILRYHGAKIFEGTIVTAGGPASFRELTDTTDGRVTQVLKWTAPDDGRITITGLVRGSPEAFAAEAEPHHDALPVVRHAVGAVADRLDRAFYDRRWDWVLSVDDPAGAELVPAVDPDSGVSYRLT
ncbi:MAG TPA: hypothetical protein VFU45_05865, partial [Gemmatimonadales bacterium]|nr:hypothetical protein [Gemmatimonadales bacterium]